MVPKCLIAREKLMTINSEASAPCPQIAPGSSEGNKNDGPPPAPNGGMADAILPDVLVPRPPAGPPAVRREVVTGSLPPFAGVLAQLAWWAPVAAVVYAVESGPDVDIVKGSFELAGQRLLAPRPDLADPIAVDAGASLLWSVLSTDARRCRAHRVSCVVVWAPAPARMVDPWLQLQSEALSAASGIESVLRYFRLPSDAVAALEAESQRLQAAVKGSLP